MIVLIGATGTGKTHVARQIADRIPVSFVCLDSMQLYGEMAIGTAAPSPEELGDTPHHFFGTFSIERPMSFARYAESARTTIGRIQASGRIPLLVGGTGLYLRFLFEPFDGLPRTPQSLRQRMDRIHGKPDGRHRLFRLLERLDPRGAAHLHPNDTQRTKRFLEVRVLTGRSILDIWEAQSKPRRGSVPVGIGLRMDRDTLWHRLQTRMNAMLDGGLIDEAKRLKDSGLADTVRQVSPIGYDHLFDFLDGKITSDVLKTRLFFATRRYAKRQKTWFKKVPYIRWFPYSPKSGYNIEEIIAWITSSIDA